MTSYPSQNMSPGPGETTATANVSRGAVGYFCPYLPEELITASGLLPLRIPVDGAVESSLSSSVKAVCVVNPCENRNETQAACFPKTPVLKLEMKTPDDDYHVQPREVGSFKHELQLLRKRLEELSGRTIHASDIRRACSQLSEIREKLRTLYEYPRSDASPIEWRDLFEFTRSGFLTDRENFLQKINELAGELGRKAAGGIPDDPRPRLMITGAALGTNDSKFLDLVKQSGGNIVTDCTCTGAMRLRKRTPAFGLIENPLDSLAEHYLYNAPGPCQDNLPRRTNYIIKAVRDYRVHGLIYYSRKNTCNTLQGEVKTIKERLYKELLVPTLIVEAESIDSNPSGLQDRITSFIDIIGGRI